MCAGSTTDITFNTAVRSLQNDIKRFELRVCLSSLRFLVAVGSLSSPAVQSVCACSCELHDLDARLPRSFRGRHRPSCGVDTPQQRGMWCTALRRAMQAPLSIQRTRGAQAKLSTRAALTINQCADAHVRDDLSRALPSFKDHVQAVSTLNKHPSCRPSERSGRSWR